MANKNQHTLIENKIDRIIYLLEHLLALELNKTNLARNGIRTHLVIDKKKVNKMLNGIKIA